MELADFNQTLQSISGGGDIQNPDFSQMNNENLSANNPTQVPIITNSLNSNESVTKFSPPEVTNTPRDLDLNNVWKILYENLKLHISERELKIWYKGIYLVKIENGVAEFSSDNQIKKEWIFNNHRVILRNKLSEIVGQNLEIAFTIRNSLNPETSTTQKKDTQPNYQFVDPTKLNSGQESLFGQQQNKGAGIFGSNNYGQGSTQSNGQSETTKQNNSQLDPIYIANLNSKYTLQTFIVGSNNQLAFAVAESVINQPGSLYNPVFFYGPSGVGKTHLMQAIGNAMRMQNPLSKIIYVPIETFMNELIEGIRTASQEAFRQKYRAADLLIIDDIQFISTYKKTQEEMFNTFNALYQDGKQIVIASDRPPKEIENLPDRLRTRFEGGMVVDIQAPDLETRIAICRQKINEHKGASVDNEIVMFIAKNIQNSVRELEGAITKVIAHQKFSRIPLTEEDVAKMLQLDIETKRSRIKPEAIINAVCEVFDLTVREIRGKRRTAHVALSRQIIMYLLREELELPLEKIAKEVNRSDHTTVIHACNKVEELLKTDERFKAKVDKVLNLVKG